MPLALRPDPARSMLIVWRTARTHWGVLSWQAMRWLTHSSGATCIALPADTCGERLSELPHLLVRCKP